MFLFTHTFLFSKKVSKFSKIMNFEKYTLNKKKNKKTELSIPLPVNLMMTV